MSLFFVDSSSELSYEEVKKLGIEMFPMPYLLNNIEGIFSEDFDYDKYYSKLKKGVENSVKNPSKEYYLNIFDKCLEQGDDIIYVHTSSKIFDTKELLEAKEDLLEKYPQRRMELIDSCNFALGYGIVAYNLAILYRQGATIDEIVEASYKIRNEYAMYLTMDSLSSLNASKLIDTNIAGTALNIKPIVTIDIDGGLKVIDKATGRKSALTKFIDNLRQKGENVADYSIGIFYSNCLSDAEILKDKIIDVLGNEIQLFVSQLSPNNACIVGLGCIGIVYHIHRKID